MSSYANIAFFIKISGAICYCSFFSCSFPFPNFPSKGYYLSSRKISNFRSTDFSVLITLKIPVTCGNTTVQLLCLTTHCRHCSTVSAVISTTPTSLIACITSTPVVTPTFLTVRERLQRLNRCYWCRLTPQPPPLTYGVVYCLPIDPKRILLQLFWTWTSVLRRKINLSFQPEPYLERQDNHWKRVLKQSSLSFHLTNGDKLFPLLLNFLFQEIYRRNSSNACTQISRTLQKSIIIAIYLFTLSSRPHFWYICKRHNDILVLTQNSWITSTVICSLFALSTSLRLSCTQYKQHNKIWSQLQGFHQTQKDTIAVIFFGLPIVQSPSTRHTVHNSFWTLVVISMSLCNIHRRVSG